MVNPNDKKLIRGFLDYIEKEGSQSGCVLMNKGNFKSNSMYFNEMPKKGDKTLVNVRFTMERPSDEDVDDYIELFLKKRT